MHHVTPMHNGAPVSHPLSFGAWLPPPPSYPIVIIKLLQMVETQRVCVRDPCALITCPFAPAPNANSLFHI